MTRTAEEWVVRFKTAKLTTAERQSFEQWLHADKKNQDSYERAVAAWNTAAVLSTLPEAELLRNEAYTYFATDPCRKARLAPRFIIPASLAFCCVLFTASVIENEHYVTEARSDFHTPVGQTQHVRLADGTELDIGADTDLTVNFDGPVRNVTLIHGEAFFAVAAGDPRPFLVQVAGTIIRDVGTRFNVETGETGLDVAVAEGRVAVALDSATNNEPTSVLDAGVAAHVSADRRDIEISRVDPAQVAIWRTGWINFNGTPLKRILQDINRYNLKKITMVDAQIGDLPLAGRIRSDDIETLLISLKSIYGITYNDLGDRIELFRSRDPAFR